MTVSIADLVRSVKESNLADDARIGEISRAIGGDAQPSPQQWARAAISNGLLTEWQANQLLRGKRTLSLGKYLILDKLESRTSYRAFLANHRQMDRQVELLVSRLTEDDNSRFLADAGRLASLDHTNLQHTFDFDIESSSAYLVMEHTPGEVLERASVTSVARIIDWGRQILSAISYLHERGLTHGSLNGQTIIVDPTHRIRIEHVERTVSPKNDATAADDLSAVGRLLSDLLDTLGGASDSSGSHSGIAEDEIEPASALRSVIRNLGSGSITSADDALQQLTNIAVPTGRQGTDSSNVAPRKKTHTSNNDNGSKTRGRLAMSSTFLVSFLVGGTFIGVGGIVALIFVLTRTPPATSLVQESQADQEQWWEQDAPAPKTAQPEAAKLETEKQKESAPQGDKRDTPKTIDLSNAGAINQPQMMDSPSESLKTKDSQTTQPAKPTGDPPKTPEVSSPKPEKDANPPAKPKEAMAPKENPFASFPAAVAIGVPGKTESVTLGEYNGTGDPLLTLVGGASAGRRNANYRISTEAKNRWNVDVVSGDQSETIGNLSIIDSELRLNWTTDGKKNVASKFLQNCVLQLSSGEYKHSMALRNSPFLLPDIVVSCDGAFTKRGVKIPALPSTESVSFEILELSQEFDADTTDYQPQSAAFGKTIEITRSPKGAQPVRLTLSIHRRREIQLSLAPEIYHSPTDAWIRLTRRGFIGMSVPVVSAYESLPDTKKKFSAIRKRLGKGLNGEQQKDLKAEHDAQIRIVEEAYKSLTATREACNAIDQIARVRIRIYRVVGERQIDLAISPPLEPNRADDENEIARKR